MKKVSHKILFFLINISLFGAFFRAEAFVGEDLGLDIYKTLDEGMSTMSQTQYEYELSGQGEGSINETVNQILSSQGLECQINSADDIERILGRGNDNVIELITQACAPGQDRVPIQLSEKVQNALRDIRRVFRDRADTKARITYEVARIGIYSDGDIKNSPFDLITDLQEINKIIFGEKLKYEGVEPVNNKSFQDFIDKVGNESTEDAFLPDDEEKKIMGEGDEVMPGEEDEVMPDTLIPEHRYSCPPPNTSGLDDDIFDILIERLNPERRGKYIPRINIFKYPEGIPSTGISWGGPFPGEGPIGNFSPTKSEFGGCDSFFCIVIEFEKSNYGLVGGESRSVKKILNKVAEHCEKPANASLTQRKQTTNNFELGSIIRNLPGMLRGLDINVSSKPIPILETLENEEDPTEEDEKKIVEGLLTQAFKDIGLDYERENDLDISGREEYVQKVFQTSPLMPITYPESRLNEFKSYDNAFIQSKSGNNEKVSREIAENDMRAFADQFTELERFTTSLEDFIGNIAGIIDTLSAIPTRTP